MIEGTVNGELAIGEAKGKSSIFTIGYTHTDCVGPCDVSKQRNALFADELQ